LSFKWCWEREGKRKGKSVEGPKNTGLLQRRRGKVREGKYRPPGTKKEGAYKLL